MQQTSLREFKERIKLIEMIHITRPKLQRRFLLREFFFQ